MDMGVSQNGGPLLVPQGSQRKQAIGRPFKSRGLAIYFPRNDTYALGLFLGLAALAQDLAQAKRLFENFKEVADLQRILFKTKTKVQGGHGARVLGPREVAGSSPVGPICALP